MSGTTRHDQRRMLCGDEYAYGLWVQVFYQYKDQPPAVGDAAYRRWLRTQPPCGHKTHPRGNAALVRAYEQHG